MAEISINETRLRELISEEVKKNLSLTFQDIEEVRRSLAGGIIRLEEEVKGIRREIDEIKLTMATKEEVKGIRREIDAIKVTMATKEETKSIRRELDAIKATMATKTTQNYLIALNIAMLGLIGSIVVKFLFFM
jgi:hypothetical protein